MSKENLHLRSQTCKLEKEYSVVNSPDQPNNIQCNTTYSEHFPQPDELISPQIITQIPTPIVPLKDPLLKPAYKSAEKLGDDRDINRFGNFPLIEIRKVDAYRNNIVEKKGHSNHFNNRAHRKVKQHLDLAQTLNHMETPFHYHRSRDKPPSFLPRPTTEWLDHLRLVNKICKVRLHNHQALDKKESWNRPSLSELQTESQKRTFLPMIGTI